MRRWAVHGAVLVAFVLLALCLTYPLLLHFTTSIPGPPADNFEFLWKVDWFRRAFFDARLSPLVAEVSFYPYGYDLSLAPTALAQMMLGMPLSLAGGSVLAYNVISILSLVLACFGAYLLVLQLTGSRIAGLAGGVIFGFGPGRVATLTSGQLNILGTMWLPYLVLSLERMVNDEGSCWGVVVGVFCALTVFSCWYLVPLVAVVFLVYIVRPARPWGTCLQSPHFRFALLTLAVILALTLGLSLPLTRGLRQQGAQTPPYSLAYVDYISPSLDYFFIPHVLRTLLDRPAVSSDVYQISLPVYAGILALLLAALGAAVRRDRVTGTFMWLGVLSLLLALGPRLRWGGEPVLIPVPAVVERVFNSGMSILATRLALNPMPSYYALHRPGTIYIPLPALALQLFVPFADKLRFWYRFVFVFSLALAVLAGIGVAYLQARLQRLRQLPSGSRYGSAVQWVLGAAIALTLFVEFAVLPYHMGYSEVRPQPVDLWLARQKDDFAIMEFPYYRQGGPGLMQYRTVFHGKRICSGAGTFAPQGHQAVRPLLYDFPNTEAMVVLKRWGPKYILVGERSYGEKWENARSFLAARSDLQPVAVFDDVPIYHDVSLLNLVPGYSTDWIVDQTHVYEVIYTQ